MIASLDLVSSSEEADMIQNHLNFQEPSIPYEIELLGEHGFLPFLNTKKWTIA